jgi:hypothetical protein
MALSEDQITQTKVEVKATLEESMKSEIQKHIDQISEGYKGKKEESADMSDKDEKDESDKDEKDESDKDESDKDESDKDEKESDDE